MENSALNMDGIVLLNKPAGMTSHDCVARMRRLSGIRKIGHTGTLDPQATGLLPLCLGMATRIIQYLEEDDKVYHCTVSFGIKSDTYDIWGTMEEPNRAEQKALTELSLEKILGTLDSFRGEIQQKPPIFSAIRKDGKRLYEYARRGEMVEIPTRNVVIHQLELLQYDDVKKQARFFVHCSKGTYVRSICHDLGEVLGCGGVMAGLVRTSCGAMNLEEAVTFEELESDKDFREHLVSMEKPLVRLGWIVAHPFQERALEDGKSILVGKNIITPPSVIGKHPIKYGVLVEGRLAAIGTVKEDRFRPEKVFKKRGMDI